MTGDIDPDLLAAYRGVAREEPAARLDARVLAAARRRQPATARRWAQAAVLALMISAVALGGRQPTAPPSPDDPRYFGLYAGMEQGALLTVDGAAPAVGADR
jgi:hypothetical protein